jgi:threonine dehydratase
LVEEAVVVDDAAAARALYLLLDRTMQLTEPAASCCLAAAERQREHFRPQDQVVLVLCGGNVSAEDLAALHARLGAAAPRAIIRAGSVSDGRP